MSFQESASAVQNQLVPGTSTSRFTWYIENFSKQNVRKLFSEVFIVGGYKWRLLVFPRGNNVEHLSMYLDVAHSHLLPPGWSRNAQFSLAVVNQFDSKASLTKEATHLFNSRESDWGFTSFMPLLDLYDSSKGYVVNDKCIIEAVVGVPKILDLWNYDSKRMTGYVGLKNQGATCYMNSLLQTLYHIPYFRKAVYYMCTTENDTPSGNIPLALQSLFYKLQHSDNSVATKELAKSFGWHSYDLFMQHDVQEFNRVLCEKLENNMKEIMKDPYIAADGFIYEGETIRGLLDSGHNTSPMTNLNLEHSLLVPNRALRSAILEWN